jgi:hypothetical protein
LSTTFQAMSLGTGGDLVENDLEALIHAAKSYSTAGQIILIADNSSSPRDMQLIDSLSVPVRIVLCGALQGVNTSYLDLARATGGSVHTIEEDLLGLAKMKEGESVEINGRRYVIHDGLFTRDI